MNHAQIKAVLEGVIPEVKAFIQAAQKPLMDRIAELEAREPIKGEPGQDGRDGLSVSIADIEQLIVRAASELPPPKDGVDGTSVTVDDVLPIITKEIEAAVSLIPIPKDGQDGVNGINGERGADGPPGELSLAPDDVADQIAKTIAMLAESPPLNRFVNPPHVGSHTQPRATSFEFERDENNIIVAAHGVDA